MEKCNFHYLSFSMNRLPLDGKIGLFFFSNNNGNERKREIEELIFHRDPDPMFFFFFFERLREKNFAESIHRKFIGGNSIVPSIQSSTDMGIYEPINSRFRSFRARTNFSYKNYQKNTL